MHHQIVKITAENYATYDLFCKKSQKKKPGYQNKVNWIDDRFQEGLTIQLLLVDTGKKKLTSRGFIEYIPGEFAWRGVVAPNYLVIHCIWVTGKYKEHGFGSKLLEKCINDAKTQNKEGVAVVISKKHWLPKEGLFIKHGFKIIDKYPPLSLMVKKFSENTSDPFFILKPSENPFQNLKKGNLRPPHPDGISIYHANQCPYMYNLVQQLHSLAKKHEISFSEILIKNRKQVESVPHPYGTCAIFYRGEFLSYSYEKDSKYEQLMQEIDQKKKSEE